MSRRVIDGRVDPAFASVADAFADAFADGFTARGEVGAAVCVTVDGETVVDLWGGHRDAARTRPWERDTLACVYSATKGITAVAAHVLVDRGALELDEPVASYWPEFGAGGKERVLVRQLLDHTAGLPAFRPRMPFGAYGEWELVTTTLAAQEPWWEPGTRHGYHAVTFGHLVGEVIRRVDGRTPGRFLAEEVCGPLGLDFHVGLPARDDARTAEMLPAPPIPADEITYSYFSDPKSLGARVFGNPPDCNSTEHTNSRAFRGPEIPAANGHGTARALVRLYGALACGGTLEGIRLLSTAAVRRAAAVQVDGIDAVMELPTRFTLGFQASIPGELDFGPSARAFGHAGSGGSLGFADPDARVGFGYVMNQMIWGASRTDPRWGPLLDALYGSL